MVAVDKRHPEAGFIELEPLVLPAIDLVWVVVGIVAIGILFAFWLVLYVLNAILGGVSFFGFHPFTFALDLVSSGMKKALGLLDSKVGNFAEFLYGLIQTIWRFTYVATDTLATLWFRQIRGEQTAADNTTAEKNRAMAQENAIAQNLTNQGNSLESQITALQFQEAQDFAYLQAQELSDYRGAIALEQQDVARLEQEIQNVHVPDISTLQTQINQLQADLTNQLNAAESTINTTINRDVSDLTQQIGQSTATAEQFALGAVAGASPGLIAQTLAQLQPQLSKIETDIGTCLDPLCDTVTPNANELGDLGKLLKALEALFGAAALTGLLVAAVEDPKRAADDVVNVAGWMSTLGLDMVNAVGEAAGVKL